MTVGARWTYELRGASRSSDNGTKELVVESFEPIPAGCHEGEMAFKMRRTEAVGFSIRWQIERTGPRIVWARDLEFKQDGTLLSETCYLQHKERIDESPERLVEGATWSEQFTEQQITFNDDGTSTSTTAMLTQNWVVLDDAATREVEEATIDDVLVTEREIAVQLKRKRYFFARGIGKVFEDSRNEEIETLLDWYIP